MLTLTGGGSVTLYVVASLGDVHIGDIPAIHGGSSASAMGWAVGSADSHDLARFDKYAVDQFVYG